MSTPPHPDPALLAAIHDLRSHLSRLAIAIEGLPQADRDLTLIAAAWHCRQAMRSVTHVLSTFSPPAPSAGLYGPAPFRITVTPVGPAIADSAQLPAAVVEPLAMLDAIADRCPAAELTTARQHLLQLVSASTRRSQASSILPVTQEMARLRLAHLPLLLVPPAFRSHLAKIATNATNWSDAQAKWHEYGLISDHNFVAESIWLMELMTMTWPETGAAQPLLDQASLYFGVSQTALPTAIDAYLPHANPKVKNFSPTYRQELRHFRRSHDSRH